MNAGNRTTEETEIRRVIEDRVAALQARDVDRLLRHYAPDFLSFDVVTPLQRSGLEDVRTRAEEWFGGFDGPIGCEIRDLSIAAGDGVAFCHSLNRVHGKTRDGATINMWVRATVGLRKQGGAWLITHDHTSVPFDVKSGQARIDLEP